MFQLFARVRAVNGQEPRVKAVFVQALEIASPAERTAFLDQACALEPELRRKVVALLKAYEDAGSFLAELEPVTGAGSADEEMWKRFDPLVQRFEKAWQSGTPPAIDEFLPK